MSVTVAMTHLARVVAGVMGGATRRHKAEVAIKAALLELYRADPNESNVEAAIALAKAAKLISPDVVRAEVNLCEYSTGRSRWLPVTAKSRIGRPFGRLTVFLPPPQKQKESESK